MDLAKELGVTSKDLVVALEGMGHKGMRAMSPLAATTANDLRVKLGRGRDLPVEAKPKRVSKAKEATPAAEEAVAVATADGATEVPPKRILRPVKTAKVELPLEPEVEAVKPTATIFRPSAAPAPPVDLPPTPAPVVAPAAPPPQAPPVQVPSPATVTPPRPTPPPVV